MASNTPARKPQLSFWQIWNMCFGFLGIQFGFALQNANVSRIFQTLSAEMDSLPGLWIAAPLTGLIVQPIIGYMSDRTWTGLGRRRPYFLAGAVLLVPHGATLLEGYEAGGLAEAFRLTGRDTLWLHYLEQFRLSPLFGRGLGAGLLGRSYFVEMRYRVQ